MTLQASGQLTMTNGCTEFGLSTSNRGLSSFYGKGQTIPTSGQISYSQLRGQARIEGGTIVKVGNYRRHYFNSSGTFTLSSGRSVRA